MTTTPAVEVAGLVKTFPAPDGGVLTAVDGVSFTVERGEIFGFLGPNSGTTFYGNLRPRWGLRCSRRSA